MHVLVASAVIAATALYLQLNKQVTLVVDGAAMKVDTFSTSVGQLLERHDVDLGPHDRVVPRPETSIADGMRIEVLHAKEITVVLNGRARTVYVTGTTVEDVLEHVNVRLRQGDRVEPSRSARIEAGDVVVFREAVQVRLSIDGKDRRIITNAPSVAYLLDSMGVVLGRRDKVAPSATAPVTQGLRIRVVRVEVKKVTEQVELPYGTRTEHSDELLVGEQRIDQAGVTGLEERRYRVRFEDGKEVRRNLLKRRVIREPVSQVVVVGTRQPNVQEGLASWYDWDGRQAPCGGTLQGLYAAHKTLPCGTQVKVTNTATGRSVTVVIRDRGPYVAGRIIDLSDEAYAQIAPLSSGTVHVRITW